MFFHGPVPPVPDKDDALDDHELRAARGRAAAGYWLPAQAVIAAAGTDWERRGHRIAVLGANAATDSAWLDAWQAAASDDPTAVTVSASTLTARAKNARGTAAASRTSAAQFRRFDELSELAMVQARRAVELDRADPTPCTILCRAMFSRGDQHGFHEALEEGRRRDPFEFGLNVMAVNFHCAKWYGSHDAMFAVARAAATAAPPGAGVAMLPLFAHFEYAMREYTWGEVTTQGLAQTHAYFRDPDVQREIDACAAKWRALGPPSHPNAILCDNWLAIAYSLGARRRDCKAVFDRIGPYAATHTWAYFYGSQAGGFLANWRWANRVD
ncbi:hypothetical protein ACFPIJ_60935 [Dactylosporangium cerinum]|uniref:DUF4034 domain-containing protein n=1 Tax=Dactylosporangium cerinum TaxID=1434730 RepID=A0ABV9WIZ3_9ACTN